MIEDYTIPPTDEFKRIHEDDAGFMHHPPIHRWHMMLKCVLNDYWFETNDDEWLDDSSQVDHFMHKLYFCWQEMGRHMYPDEEEE